MLYIKEIHDSSEIDSLELCRVLDGMLELRSELLTSRDSKLEECICRLQEVKKQISMLANIEKKLTGIIINEIGHDKDGQKTYYYNQYAVEVKTPTNYTLDKTLYKKFKDEIPAEVNVVDEVVEYKLNRKKLSEAIKLLDDDKLSVLGKFIDAKPGKPSVNIKPNTNGQQGD